MHLVSNQMIFLQPRNLLCICQLRCVHAETLVKTHARSFTQEIYLQQPEFVQKKIARTARISSIHATMLPMMSNLRSRRPRAITRGASLA